jgi:hypothetical protein
VALLLALSISEALADPITVVVHEDSREYRNTGQFILKDPDTNETLGKYDFVTGGGGRGSAPFGTYHIGRFRHGNDDDDPLNIGPRWMVGNPEMDEGEALDPNYKTRRTELELHHGRTGRTLGCIGILGSQNVWQEFMRNLNGIISKITNVNFVLGSDAGAVFHHTPPDRDGHRHVFHGHKVKKKHKHRHAHH